MIPIPSPSTHFYLKQDLTSIFYFSIRCSFFFSLSLPFSQIIPQKFLRSYLLICVIFSDFEDSKPVIFLIATSKLSKILHNCRCNTKFIFGNWCCHFRIGLSFFGAGSWPFPLQGRIIRYLLHKN